MLNTEQLDARGPDTEALLRTINERIAARGLTGKAAADMREKVLTVLAQERKVREGTARSQVMDAARQARGEIMGPPTPPPAARAVGIPTGKAPEQFVQPDVAMPQTPLEMASMIRRAATQENVAGGVGAAVSSYLKSTQSGLLDVLGTGAGVAATYGIGDGTAAEAAHAAAQGLSEESAKEASSSPMAMLGNQAMQSAPTLAMLALGRGASKGAIGPRVAAAGNAAIMTGGYMVPSAGQGIQAYRQEMLSRGELPNPAVEAAQGIGFATAEMLFERVGMDATGEQMKHVADGFANAYLANGAKGLAKAATAGLTAMGVNGAEELATQIAQNGIQQTYQPTQDIWEGTSEATLGGMLQGGGMAAGAGIYGAVARPTRPGWQGPTNAPQTPPPSPSGAPQTPPKDPANAPLVPHTGQATAPLAAPAPVSWMDAKIAELQNQLSTPTPGVVTAENSDQEMTNGEEAQRRQGLLSDQQTEDDAMTPAPAAGATRRSFREAMIRRRDQAVAKRQAEAANLSAPDDQEQPTNEPERSVKRPNFSREGMQTRREAAMRRREEQQQTATFEHPGHDWVDRSPVAGDFAPGRSGALYLTNGEETTVEYGIGEADDMIPTHDPAAGYEPIPEGDRNERPYQHPTEGAPSRKTVQDITKLDKPATLVSDDPTPVNGPPQVTRDLRALGGNARMMGMKMIYRAGGETAYRLKDLMVRSAERFGIDPRRVRKMKHPILVRRINDDVGPRGSWSRKLNLPLTTERTNDADAVSRGTLLKPEHIDRISSLFTGDEDTIRSIMRDKPRAAKLVQTLVDSGAITESDLVKMLNKDGSVSTEGRNTIEKALLGSTVGDIYAMAQASDATKNKLLRAMGSFAVLRHSDSTKASGFQITDIAAAALDALASMKESGARSFEDLLSQTSMVREMWRDNPRAIGMARSLKEDGPIKFAKKMAEVAAAASESKQNAGQASMFGDALNEDPGVAFDRVFEVDAAASDGTVQSSADPSAGSSEPEVASPRDGVRSDKSGSMIPEQGEAGTRVRERQPEAEDQNTSADQSTDQKVPSPTVDAPKVQTPDEVNAKLVPPDHLDQVVIIIKPLGVEKKAHDAIKKFIAESGGEIKDEWSGLADPTRITAHYAGSLHQSYGPPLVKYFVGKPVVVYRVWVPKGSIPDMRARVGPSSVKPGTLRYELVGESWKEGYKSSLATDNAIHLSDAPEAGIREAKVWFGVPEIQSDRPQTKAMHTRVYQALQKVERNIRFVGSNYNGTLLREEPDDLDYVILSDDFNASRERLKQELPEAVLDSKGVVDPTSGTKYDKYEISYDGGKVDIALVRTDAYATFLHPGAFAVYMPESWKRHHVEAKRAAKKELKDAEARFGKNSPERKAAKAQYGKVKSELYRQVKRLYQVSDLKNPNTAEPLVKANPDLADMETRIQRVEAEHGPEAARNVEQAFNETPEEVRGHLQAWMKTYAWPEAPSKRIQEMLAGAVVSPHISARFGVAPNVGGGASIAAVVSDVLRENGDRVEWKRDQYGLLWAWPSDQFRRPTAGYYQFLIRRTDNSMVSVTFPEMHMLLYAGEGARIMGQIAKLAELEGDAEAGDHQRRLQIALADYLFEGLEAHRARTIDSKIDLDTLLDRDIQPGSFIGGNPGSSNRLDPVKPSIDVATGTSGPEGIATAKKDGSIPKSTSSNPGGMAEPVADGRGESVGTGDISGHATPANSKSQQNQTTFAPALTLSDKDRNRLKDIFQTLGKSGSTLKMGVDPKDMLLAIEASTLVIKGGMATFAAFARFMVSQLGDAIKPRLRQLYQMARYEPGMDTSAMTSEAIVSQMTEADINGMVADTIPANGGNDEQQPAGVDTGSRGNVAPGSDRNDQSGDAVAAEGNAAAPAVGDQMEPGAAGPRQPGGDGTGASAGEAGTNSASDVSGVDPAAAADGAGGGEPDGNRPRGSEPDAPPVDPAKLAPEDRNHVIQEGDVIAPSGNSAKLAANLKAIRLLKELEAEKRNPTPSEKKILAQYTGWGWAGEYFNERDPDKYERFRKQREAIEPHMTDEEKASARRSTTNAHYTATEVVRPMWDLVRRLGFKGGRVLEPAAGVGNFFGLMPEDLAAASKLIGVELDSLSGRILRKLYPQADIRVEGFQNSPIANNSIDVAISNVPFGDYKISARDYKGQLIHDYFFLRALDKVKPGGLVVFITSDGTLNKIKTDVRSMLAEKADLVGAIRLPNNAFEKNAGTQVTTDIIVLRKKDGRQVDQIPWINTVEIGGKQVQVRDEDGNPVLDDDNQPKTQYVPMIVNEYFKDRPEMALGKHTLEGTMYAKDDYALVARKGQDTGALLRHAIETLPANIMSDLAPAKDFGTIKRQAGERDGSYVMRDDNFFQVQGEELRPADWLKEKLSGDDWSLPIDAATREKRIAIAKDWFKLRDAALALTAAERNPESDNADVETLRKKLKAEYEAFKKKRGTLNRVQRHLSPAYFLEADPDYYLVSSLEVEKTTTKEEVAGQATKGRKVVRGGKVFRETVEYLPHPIMERRMRTPKAIPTKANSVEDAVSISMGWYSKIDSDLVGRLLGLSKDAAERKILESGRALRDPSTGQLVAREHYLGGNVRAKLAAAKEAALADKSYADNVKALEAVQPKDTPIGDVKFTLASRWVPTDVVEAFARSVFGASNPSIRYVRQANGYEVSLGTVEAKAGRYRVNNADREILPGELLNHALNGTLPKLMRNVGDKRQPKWVLDAENTKLAEVRIAELNDAFGTYARTTKDTVEVLDQDEQTRATNKALANVGISLDPRLSMRTMSVPAAAQRAFNERVNNVVPIEYDGSHLALPGMTDIVRRLPHRLSVVARILHEGAAVMAHGVGSGKTFSQIVAAMEMRRLGMAKKPMIVVQKSTVGQFATSFMQAYPDAKILVANEKTFAAKNRKRLMAQVALGDWDAVIVTHPQFDKIASKPERVMQYIGAKVEELRDAIAHEEEQRRLSGGRFKSATQKQMEARLQKLEAKMQDARMQADQHQDRNVYFEDMGVDFLLIDEAHNYKRAPIVTRKTNVKGVPNDHSAKALNLEMKTQGLQAKQNGRGVVLSTGTPITNTMAEAYVMLKLATPNVLKDYDMSNFDEWADTFGVPRTDVERTWSGRYKAITRFKKFINGHELIKMIRSGFDVKIGNKELGLEVPAMAGGKPESVIVKQTPASQRISDWLLAIGSAYDEAEPKVRALNSWVPITTMQTGIAASLDPRLVDPTAPDDPGSKVNLAVAEILKTHEEWADRRGTQIVFCDRFAPMNTARLEAFGGSLNGGGSTRIDSDSVSIPGTVDVDMTEPDEDGNAESVVSADDEEKQQAEAEAEEYKNARFNVYKDIKAKLIAKGVPADEIAIIHDFNTDPKKEQLFKDMNNGMVRILLGSTEKAGVGVNVQARLVALLELDPPRTMTPAMQEQRWGRIIRQGNVFATQSSPEYDPDFKVRVIQFGLEDSMEAGVYQLLEHKLKFITQALMGRVVGREFEDPAGEVIMSVMEMKAKLTGDHRVIRFAELQKIISDLELERGAIESQAATNNYERDDLLSRAQGTARAAETLRSEQKQVEHFVSVNPILASYEMSHAKGEDAAKELIARAYADAEAQWKASPEKQLGYSPSSPLWINGWKATVIATQSDNDPNKVVYRVRLKEERSGTEFAIAAPKPGHIFGGAKRYLAETIPERLVALDTAAREYRRQADALAAIPVAEFPPEKARQLREALAERAMIELQLQGKWRPKSHGPAGGPARSGGFMGWLDTKIGDLERSMEEGRQSMRRGAKTFGVATRTGGVVSPVVFIDAAYLVALKAIRAGITKGIKLSRIVRETVQSMSGHRPELVGQEKTIRKMARKWLKLGNNEEALEGLYHDARQMATNPQTRAARKAAALARKEQVTALDPKGMRSPKPGLTPESALAGALKMSQRDTKRAWNKMAGQVIAFVKKAQTQGKIAGRAEARVEMERLIWEHSREMARLREAYAARKIAHRAEQRKAERMQSIMQLRTDLAQLASALPLAIRGKMIPAITKSTTIRDLRRAVNRGLFENAKYEGREQVRKARKLNKHLKKLGESNRYEFTKAQQALNGAWSQLKQMGPKDIVGSVANDPIVDAAETVAKVAIAANVTGGEQLTQLVEAEMAKLAATNPDLNGRTEDARRLVKQWLKAGATASNVASFADVARKSHQTVNYRIDDAEVQQATDLATVIADSKAAMTMALKAQQDEDDTQAYVRNWNAKQIRSNSIAAIQQRSKLPEGDTPSRRDVNVLRQFGRKYWNPRTLFMELDGDFNGKGPMFGVYKALYRARESQLARKHRFIDSLEATVRKHGYPDLGTFLAETSGTLGTAGQATVTIPLYHVGIGLQDTKVTLGQAMEIYAKDDQTQMWAHKGTPFVFREDPDGQQYLIPDTTWDAVKHALTAQQRAIVDESKAAYERQTWDDLTNLSKRLRGKYLTKVNRYWGVRRASAQGTQNGVPPAWRDSIPVLEESDILQDRTGGNLPIIIGDFGLDILNRADASASILAKADVIRLARMTVLHPDVRTEINNRMGASTVERLEQIVQAFAGANEPAKRARWLSSLIGNSNRSYTQLWIPSWFRNIGSVFRQIHRYPVASVLKGFAQFAAAPLETYKVLRENAPILRERYAGATGMMAYAVPGQASTSTAKMKQAFGATIRQVMETFALAMRGDVAGAARAAASIKKPYREWLDSLSVGNLFDVAAAGAIYHVERARGKSVRTAARIASRRFDEVANTNDELTSTGWQSDAKNNPVLGLWLTFTSDIAKAQNMLYASARRGKRHFARTAAAVALSIAWSAGVTMAWSSMLGKGAHAAGLDSVRRAANELVSLVPGGNNIGGPLINMASGTYTANTGLNAPVINLVETAIKGVADAVDAIDITDDKRTRPEIIMSAVEKLGAAIGQAAGLPVGQYLHSAQTAYKHWRD